MAILRVAQMGHPILRMICQPVETMAFATPEFQGLCDDMLDTLYEYDGAGLAAPQVHVPLRVVVLTLEDARGPEFFVNPVITPLSDEKVWKWEGCLSVDGIRGKVERFGHVRIEAFDRYGQAKAYELQGFPAVVVQHECDHLDGILYIDKADRQTLAFLSEYRKWGPLDELDDLDDLDDLEELDEDEDEDDDITANDELAEVT